MEFDLAHALAILERTPTVLRALLAGLPDAWTVPNEGGESWSATDVVGHLIDGEEADWIPRLEIVLEQGENRTFRPFDRTRHETEQRGVSLADRLDRFERLRRENLTRLTELRITSEQLLFEAEHPAFGTVTGRQLLATWVVHDLGHLAQISRVMAKQYRDEVGPWQEYLSVLHR
ncbi:MAG: DinB family protein [Candidatus Eisenbacteria bacterium]|uniref:DinB family protein n=1 Tax=Eiseniibacteriota bacterium TaxID=2212470 RepID=A0A956N868_UNCEI|nr:DinB family protein [Candidatus Eisenbacteria bacterium]MCB9466226.1 DinB family protein [Candidatus Eisenbacteria bacterium]